MAAKNILFVLLALAAGPGSNAAVGAGLLDSVPLIIHAGDSEAWTAVVSVPMPKRESERLYRGGAPVYSINGKRTVARPLGWRVRDEIPRRTLLYISRNEVLGEKPLLSIESGSDERPKESPWKVSCHAYEKHDWLGYEVILRGGSNEKSHSEWDDLVLAYKDRELRLRFGARREKFHGSAAMNQRHDWWQWVKIETLFESEDITLVRAGGLLYNEDSFMHCDVYLELYGNGVARAFAHFVNSRVIGDGWEYYGIPVIGMSAEERDDYPIELDGSVTRFQLDKRLQLDISDSADLVSEEHPGQIYRHGGLAVYQPWEDQRITDRAMSYGKKYVTDIGEGKFPRGAARTARFTLSLSDAPPRVAQLLSPSWLYAMAGELWPGENLPVQWRFGHTPHQIGENIARPDMDYHGTFEAGYSNAASEGNGAAVLLYSAMYSGDINHLHRGLAWGYFWADIAVNHVDWSVWQTYTGYYWKTHPYWKFGGLVWTYLETGDPYLLETAEHVADSYWALIRSTWPARTMGRGTWPVDGLLVLYKHTQKPVYLERALDVIEKSIATYSGAETPPGHQIGVGPNGIGNLTGKGSQGFGQLVLARTAIQAALLETPLISDTKRQRLLEHAERVTRIVVEDMHARGDEDQGGWRHYETGMLISMELPLADKLGKMELANDLEYWLEADEEYQTSSNAGRPYHAITGRAYYDAATLGAAWEEDRLVFIPRFLPAYADGKIAEVETPVGRIRVRIQINGDGEVEITPLEK